eukprot:1180980-Prorocentrum_minimum.AAC.2
MAQTWVSVPIFNRTELLGFHAGDDAGSVGAGQPLVVERRQPDVFPLPFCDWCPLRVCSLSPSAIGARYGYVLSPLLRLVRVAHLAIARAGAAEPLVRLLRTGARRGRLRPFGG